MSNLKSLLETGSVALQDPYIEKHHVSSLDFAKQCGDECDDYIQLALADETQLPKESFPFVRALTRELGFKPALPLLLSSYSLLQPKKAARKKRQPDHG